MDVDMGEHVCMEGGELFCPQNNGGDIRRVRERFGIEVVHFGLLKSPPLPCHQLPKSYDFFWSISIPPLQLNCVPLLDPDMFPSSWITGTHCSQETDYISSQQTMIQKVPGTVVLKNFPGELSQWRQTETQISASVVADNLLNKTKFTKLLNLLITRTKMAWKLSCS